MLTENKALLKNIYDLSDSIKNVTFRKEYVRNYINNSTPLTVRLIYIILAFFSVSVIAFSFNFYSTSMIFLFGSAFLLSSFDNEIEEKANKDSGFLSEFLEIDKYPHFIVFSGMGLLAGFSLTFALDVVFYLIKTVFSFLKVFVVKDFLQNSEILIKSLFVSTIFVLRIRFFYKSIKKASRRVSKYKSLFNMQDNFIKSAEKIFSSSIENFNLKDEYFKISKVNCSDVKKEIDKYLKDNGFNRIDYFNNKDKITLEKESTDDMVHVPTIKELLGIRRQLNIEHNKFYQLSQNSNILKIREVFFFVIIASFALFSGLILINKAYVILDGFFLPLIMISSFISGILGIIKYKELTNMVTELTDAQKKELLKNRNFYNTKFKSIEKKLSDNKKELKNIMKNINDIDNIKEQFFSNEYLLVEAFYDSI